MTDLAQAPSGGDGLASDLIDRAAALLRKGDAAGAIEAARAAVRADPVSAAAHFMLAKGLRRENQTAAADAHAQEAVLLDSTHVEALLDLAQSRHGAGRSEEARKIVDRALTLQPENVAALITMGNICRAQGDTNAARTVYARAVAADANSAPAHNAFGLALVSDQKLDEAIGHFRRALEIAPRAVRPPEQRRAAGDPRGAAPWSIWARP